MCALSSENTNSQFIVYATLKKEEVLPKENESRGVISSPLTALSLFFFLFSFYYYLSCSPLYSLVLHTFISLAIWANIFLLLENHQKVCAIKA